MMTDDDAAVLADQLEQQGELDRANVIRLQRVRGAPWDRDVISAGWEADDLIARHGDDWRAQLPVVPGVEWGELRDGFVATAKLDTFHRLYEVADQLAAASPALAEITIRDAHEPDVPAPELPWLRRLRIETEFSTGPLVLAPAGSLIDRVPELELVMTSYDLDQDGMLPAGLRTPKSRFAMTGDHIGGVRLANEVASCAAFGALHTLDLGTRFVDYNYNYYGEPTFRVAGAAALATSGVLANVEVLDLTRQRIADEGFAAIGPKLARVRELRLGVNDLTTLAPLAPGPALDRLNVYYNQLSAGALAAMPRLAELKELVLDTCELTELGPITEAPWWSTLRILDLSRNDLSASQARWSSAATPPHLHTLRLADCDLQPSQIADLAAVPWLARLIELALDGAPLSPELLARLGGVKKLSLVGCTGAPIANVWNAVHLDLSRTTCELADHAPELQTLVLRGATVDVTRLTPAAFPKLRELDLGGIVLAGRLGHVLELAPQLTRLGLRGCQLDASDVQALASRGVGRVKLLDLREHPHWTPASYQELARSPLLRDVKLRLEATPWQWPQPLRDELDARFGQGWHWPGDDDAPNDDEGA